MKFENATLIINNPDEASCPKCIFVENNDCTNIEALSKCTEIDLEIPDSRSSYFIKSIKNILIEL